MQKLLLGVALLLATMAIQPAFSQFTSFSRFVASSADDVEEYVPGGTGGTVGYMYLNSSDLELAYDGTIKQHIGVRFTNITIPQGAIIQNAYIQFATKGDKTPTSGAIVIKGQAIDNAPTFTSTAFNLTTRVVTTDSVTWAGSTSTTWGTTGGGTRGADQKTPDLKTIVQGLVNRSGWASGNAMAFLLKGEGVRNAYAYDGSTTLAPELIIQYTSNIYPTTAFPITVGGSWKYSDQGTLPAANWADSNYNDASWTFGYAKLGYGDNAVTAVSYGADAANKYITTYFRYIFNMANTSQYDSLILRMLRDDGAIVYVNGVEVFRSNMPAGPVTNSTLALSDVSGQNENAYFSAVIKNNLVNGRNTIAVEVHQASATSDDLAFDFQLIPKPVVMPVINFPVPKNSQWNYLDDGTDQGTVWTQGNFSDGAWLYGPGKLGYSDNPATTLGFGPVSGSKYITYYFRKKINVPSVAALGDSVELNILRDDGAIIYINGTEIIRSNMPAGPFTYQTFSSTIVDADESTYFTYRLPKSVLIDGINTIAVEVHQRDGTSSDLGFDLELKEVGGAALLRGPYLQSGTSTSMVIRWRTDAATNSRVRIGTSAEALNLITDNAAAVTEHEIKVSGLTPLTKYYYSVGSTSVMLQGDTANYFSTLPTPGATGLVRIGVIGDCGNNSTNQIQVRNQLKNYLGNNYMNSWILLGDNAYSYGTDAEFQAEFFNIYKDGFLKQNPMYPCPGNHDYNNGASVAQNDHAVPYYSIFSMPTNGEAGGVASNNKAYYSFDMGNVHFLSLDSYGKEDNATRLYDTLGKQVQWIKADLAANKNKGWVVAYWHHPPYTKGSHNSDTEGELVNIRTNFIQILERMGVDLILCGHSHDYERSKLQKGHYGLETSFDETIHNLSTSSALYDGTSNSCPYTKDSVTRLQGTVYVVSGSAGQLGGTTAGYPHDAMYYSNATNGGSMILEVEGNRLDAKWVCADGVIRDHFTMMKDVKKSIDTVISMGSSITLSASYIGTYSWQPGNQNTKSITVTPPVGITTYVVKDSYDCIVDSFKVTVNAPLPLAWGNIKGWYEKNSKAIQLQWQTLNEQDNSYFEIERSLEGNNFVYVGKVNAMGNSNAALSYNFLDKQIDKEKYIYYYRIKQVDKNGAYKYSPTVAVKMSGSTADVDVQVLPNQGRSSEMKIRLLNMTSLQASLKLTDASRRVLFNNPVALNASLQSFMPDVKAGVYFLTIVTESAIMTKQIIVH